MLQSRSHMIRLVGMLVMLALLSGCSITTIKSELRSQLYFTGHVQVGEQTQASCSMDSESARYPQLDQGVTDEGLHYRLYRYQSPSLGHIYLLNEEPFEVDRRYAIGAADSTIKAWASDQRFSWLARPETSNLNLARLNAVDAFLALTDEQRRNEYQYVPLEGYAQFEHAEHIWMEVDLSSGQDAQRPMLFQGRVGLRKYHGYTINKSPFSFLNDGEEFRVLYTTGP